MNRRFRYYTYIQPILRSPIIKSYGLHILTIFTMIIFIIFAIKPTAETILVLQKKIENSQTGLQNINQKSENLTLAKNNYQSLDSQTRSKIQSLVPSQFDLKNLIQTLEETATANQATMSALQIQPFIIEGTLDSLQKKTLAEIEFTYNIEGTYPNLLKLLKQLQMSPRLISLKNLIINKSSGGNNLIMSISGKAYYLK